MHLCPANRHQPTFKKFHNVPTLWKGVNGPDTLHRTGVKFNIHPPPSPHPHCCAMPLQHFLQDFPTRFSATISHKIFPQQFPTRFSHNNFLQDFPTRFSCKIFLQDFLELDPDWMAPHHPIPNAKFPPIIAFVKLAFSSPPFLTRFSCKIFPQEFPQEFPARFSQAGSWLVGSPSPYS